MTVYAAPVPAGNLELRQILVEVSHFIDSTDIREFILFMTSAQLLTDLFTVDSQRTYKVKDIHISNLFT